MANRAAMTKIQYSQVRIREKYHCLRHGSPSMEGAWHHRRGKAVRDEHTHCSCNGVWLCHTCHRWVHANPFEARQSGLIVSRVSLVMPTDVPVQTALHGLVRLNCSGGYEFDA